jgi:retinol dehydrogenase 14
VTLADSSIERRAAHKDQRIAVVTGASGGMGRATAAILAEKHNMKVYLLARNKEKGQAAVDYVNLQSGRTDAELVLCDLASLDSIRGAAANLAERCNCIDILINNAGVITLRREETEDGFERQLGVNQLGHFLLTGLLIPLLRQSDSARIIIVSSNAYKIGRMDYMDPGMTKRFRVWSAYGRSKMANLWFMKELSARMAGTSITVNAVHPGAVATQIGGAFVQQLLRPFFLTPEQGSVTAVYLASSAEVEGKSGQYYYRMQPQQVSELADSREETQRFWNWSEQATGFIWSLGQD